MKKFLAVIALASSLSAGAAAAQDQTDSMGAGLSMLEVAVAREFSRIGITDVDPMSLSLNQLAQIRSVMGSSEYTVNEQKRQIETIVARN